MRKSNMEIEFKTAIDKKTYEEMLELFDLESNIFKQTNYYFDTDDLSLNKDHIVLRIRQKGQNHFKVTMKKQSGTGAFESHVVITKDKAKEMIQNGFEVTEFFSEIDKFVTFKASLDNHRVSTYFEGGTLFFDRSTYGDVVDYEIEYEVNNYDEGKVIFDNFLNKQGIPFKAAKRKSERALQIK